jgi:hypothetical protein
MTLQRHLVLVLESISRYQNSEYSLKDLQYDLSAIMSAMENDIPKKIRDAVRSAESQIDSIRFTVNESDQRAHVERVLNELESVMKNLHP